MKLAIFDIDGTLTRTNRVDELVYTKTIQKLLNASYSPASFNAERFTHYTDSCILPELYEWELGRLPNENEKTRFKELYLQLLNEAHDKQPGNFQAVPGAASILYAFPKNWRIALATGCWRESAQAKLAYGEIETLGIPLATASDAMAREDIIKHAIELSENMYQNTEFEHIVYIGDGVWDLRTCATLKLPFVGIDAENDLDKRKKLGDYFFLKNYEEKEKVFACLEAAKYPILQK